MERPCPLCGAHAAEHWYRPTASPGPVSRCRHCSMVYVSEIEENQALIVDGPVIFEERDRAYLDSVDYTAVAHRWEFRYLRDKEAEWPAIRQNAARALGRLAKHRPAPANGSRLLDFGSAWGFFLAAAREEGWEPYGLEPLVGCAAYARAKFGVPITADTLRERTFPPAFFDAVTAFQVFEHLPEPARDLEILRGLLRDGGLVLIEVPNIRSWSVALLRRRHRHFTNDHINFFSPDTLARLLRGAGFDVLETWLPARRMTTRHLVDGWLARAVPRPALRAFGRALQAAGAWERVISVNLLDIVAVIARRRA